MKRTFRIKHIKVVGLVIAIVFFGLMLTRSGTMLIRQSGRWNALIESVPLERDLSTVSDGSTHRCRFAVRNIGKRPLVIERVRVGCAACLKVIEAPTRPILPGGEDDLLAEFHAESSSGLVVHTLAVHSNDPVQPVLILKIKADIQPAETPADAANAPGASIPAPASPPENPADLVQ